jgi:hypothetical protein
MIGQAPGSAALMRRIEAWAWWVALLSFGAGVANTFLDLTSDAWTVVGFVLGTCSAIVIYQMRGLRTRHPSSQEDRPRRLSMEATVLGALFIALAFTSTPTAIIVVLFFISLIFIALREFLIARRSIEAETRRTNDVPR